MDDQLIKLATFASANEAAVARNALEAAGIPASLDGDATATWLWHFGTALGGVKLFVRSSDADRAHDILSHPGVDAISELPEDTYPPDDGLEQEEKEDEDEGEPTSPHITRAWRAAVIGILFFPPLLNLYSMWVLLRHGLLFRRKGGPANWRAVTALIVNLSVFAMVGLLGCILLGLLSSR